MKNRKREGDSSRRVEDLKANFFLTMKEILSSRDELCRGVESMVVENNIALNVPDDRSRLTELIIKKRADISKGVGVAANLPSAVTIVGAIATTTFTAAVEFISLIRLEIEMCLEIAHVYEKVLDDERLVEALALIGCHQYDHKEFKGLDDVAIKSGVKKAVKSYAKKGALLMAERIAMRIELASLRKHLSRFIPLLGMPIAAGMNYRETMSVGKLAHIYYG